MKLPPRGRYAEETGKANLCASELSGDVQPDTSDWDALQAMSSCT